MSNTPKKKVIVIGAGFSSLSAACFLAKSGFQVEILEKNDKVGGRARQLKKDDFTFDIGPTFYWMPDVFESFFNDFDKKVCDYYELIRLNPGYQVYFAKGESISIPNRFDKIVEIFEEYESGAGEELKKFIGQAESNYNIAIKDLVYKPGQNIFEIITPKTAMKLGLFFKSIQSQVRQHIQHPYLRKILEFPVLFLGAKPSNTPAFYNFMNYADLVLGTWHPKGGMYEIVKGMTRLAESLGVNIKTNCEISKINIVNDKVKSVTSKNAEHSCDILLSGADYHFTESLLPKSHRQYSTNYWEKKTFAPSALLFYIGFNKKLKHLSHHTLFFDTDFEKHAQSIYDDLTWPNDPLFYGSFPSITDSSAAPMGKEAGIILIPIAPGLKDDDSTRRKYLDIIINRIEYLTDQEIQKDILFVESYCVNDFISDYHSYKGNAYGLANTLFQTHILRPKLKSKKVKNLYFTGQLTVPGPGVPPSIISGKIVNELINKYE